jgi:tetratricopeptide (TPR) repeat protein
MPGEDGWAARASALMELRRYDDALDAARHGLAEQPDSYQLRCLESQALLGLEHGEDAQRAAERAIAAQPAGEWGHRLRAHALLQQAAQERSLVRNGLLNEAARSAQQSVAVAPQLLSGYLTLTTVAVAKRDIRAADEASRQAVTLAPASSAAWVARSQAALAARQWAEAEEAARMALQHDPENYAAHNNLGVALRHRGKNRDAAAALTRAARIDPGRETAQNNLARFGQVLVGLIPAVVLIPLLFLVHNSFLIYLLVSVVVGRLLAGWRPVRDWSLRFGIKLGARRSSAPASTTLLGTAPPVRPLRRQSRLMVWLLIGISALLALVAVGEWSLLSTQPASKVVGPAVIVTVLAVLPAAALIAGRRH